MGQSSLLLRPREGRRPTVSRQYVVLSRSYAVAAFAGTERDPNGSASPPFERLRVDRLQQAWSLELAAPQLQAVERATLGHIHYTSRLLDDGRPPPAVSALAASRMSAELAASRLKAAVVSKCCRDEYARAREEYYEEYARAWDEYCEECCGGRSRLGDSPGYDRRSILGRRRPRGPRRDAIHAAQARLQAVARSKLVRNNFVPDDSSPPSTQTSTLRRSYTPSPSSSTASAAPTASPGSPASPTPLPSPCAIFPSPPSPFPFDAASAATVLSTRARAALHQHCLRASQAAAATLTTRIRASLARIRDNYRRAALPGPRASVVNTNLTEAPSGSSAFCSPTSSAAFQRAQPLKSSSTPADQAAATTLSAFARAAPARTGYISQTAALPSCPRADNQASNFKFTAAPKGRPYIPH